MSAITARETELDAERIKRKALDLGFMTAGVCLADPPEHLGAYNAWIEKGYHGTMEYLARGAGARADPGILLPGARSVIAVALAYGRAAQSTPGVPRIARYALGRDYHKVMRAKLRRLQEWLSEQAPGHSHRACVDTAPILERYFAHKAGMGWFGKNTMLIDSKRGSWFFIGLVLTTLDLSPDAPSLGGCGTCRRCVSACPTGALVLEDGRWQLDARRCISYLTIEHRGAFPEDAQLAGWAFGCDVCQEVCPFNEERVGQPLRGAKATDPDLLSGREWPALDSLRTIGYEEWDELTRGSAVRRAGWEGLRRNARHCR